MNVYRRAGVIVVPPCGSSFRHQCIAVWLIGFLLVPGTRGDGGGCRVAEQAVVGTIGWFTVSPSGMYDQLFVVSRADGSLSCSTRSSRAALAALRRVRRSIGSHQQLRVGSTTPARSVDTLRSSSWKKPSTGCVSGPQATIRGSSMSTQLRGEGVLQPWSGKWGDFLRDTGKLAW